MSSFLEFPSKLHFYLIFHLRLLSGSQNFIVHFKILILFYFLMYSFKRQREQAPIYWFTPPNAYSGQGQLQPEPGA